MIENTPTNTTSVHSPNNLQTTTTSTSCVTNAATPTQCDYNFLKRKLAVDKSSADHSAIVNNSENSAVEYENAQNSTQAWKKRHIEESNAAATDTGCFNSNTEYNSYALQHGETTILIDTLQTGNVQNEICVSTSATNTITTTNINNSSIIINNNNNNNNSSSDNNKTSNSSSSNYSNNNNNNMTFNLITDNHSSFINDIFAYDANLIVPVPASLVSHNTSGSTASATLPAFATPTNVCMSNNNNYDDANNWQATDLLELDHRYNSGLQTEIAHLQPTVPLKATEELALSTHNRTTQQQTQEQQAQSISQSQFLVPENQITRSSINTQLSRCRSSAAYPSLQSPQQIHQQSMPPPATADTDVDFEDRNLSWLLNFKFDEFPHLSPDLGANSNTVLVGGKTVQIGTQQQSNVVASASSSQKSNCSSPQSTSVAQHSSNDHARSSKGSTKAGKKFEELVMEVTSSEVDGNEMVVGENITVGNSPPRAPKKPPFTYTELIEYALEDKGELTVSGIYQWISDRFPYYKSNDDRWKNSVRHNLSINPHFRKGLKAPQGAGHLWTISSGDSAENVLAWEHKKQRLDLFFKMESMNRERLARLTCSSPHPDCQQHHQQQQQQRQRQEQQQQQQCVYDEAAVAAAAITREMLNSSGSGTEDGCEQNCNNMTDNNNQRLESSTHLVHELPFNDLMSDEELRKTAGQILNGIHREVEVQSVNSIISTYHDVMFDNEDYLNPIHKDVAVHESGLRSTNATHLPSASYLQSQSSTNSQYYVTEIDPLELGIQMSHQVGAEEVLFSDELNLNYFGYNGANDIVA